MAWRAFWKTALWSTCGLAALLYGAILILDPYDSIWFSPPFDRAPIVTNQRFAYPAVARNPAFDSIVIGTSTTRLLRPEKLDEVLGGRFANVSLNSGTAYEQSQLFHVFARHHPQARAAIMGIDVIWCGIGDSYEKFTPRPFPPWLYDDDPWNDLRHVFNIPTVEQAGRLLAFLFGLRDAKYGKDGYANFLPPQSEYDEAKVLAALYGDAGPRRRAPVAPPADPTGEERSAWRFPTHALLDEILSALPSEALKILIFVPYHHFSQPPQGSLEAVRWQECKRRVAKIASRFANSHVLDFMIASQITLRDQNYWDPLHFGTDTADRLGELIAIGVREKCGLTGLMDYLTPPRIGEAEVQVCEKSVDRTP